MTVSEESHANAIGTVTSQIIFDCGDMLGEAPNWDARTDTLYWSDNHIGRIHAARQSLDRAWEETSHWDLARPIAGAIPRESGGLVVAAGIELLVLDPVTGLQPLATLESDPEVEVLNEIKCDQLGRLWAGTRDRMVSVAGAPISRGRCGLYCLEPNRVVRKVLSDVTLANGMGWSPDNAIFYFIDTYERTVFAFDVMKDFPFIGNRRPFFKATGEQGLPDGLAVDASGCLWVAMVGGGRVQRISPDGVLLEVALVGTPTVTSCSFCGADASVLAITTSRFGLPDEARLGMTEGLSLQEISGSDAVGAGGLYMFRPGIRGTPTRSFAG